MFIPEHYAKGKRHKTFSCNLLGVACYIDSTNNSCANFYYNRTDTIVDIYISTKFIAFLYRTDTKVEIMFIFTSKFSDDFKTDASSILNPVLPDDYSFLITESSWANGTSKRSSTKRRSVSKEKTWRTCFFLSTEK